MDAQSARRRLPRFVRIIRARPRLMLSTLVGIVVVVLLPAPWRPSTRALIGWDIGVAVYLTAAGIMVARSDIARIRRHAALQDEGQLAILALTVAAALATLGAILADLSSAPPGAARPASALMLATVTIVLAETEQAARDRQRTLDELHPSRPDGLHFVGTPARLAANLQEWADRTGAAGFHIRPAVLPDDLDLFAGEVVPALRVAGAFRQAYSGKTLRDHLGLGRAVNQYAGV